MNYTSLLTVNTATHGPNPGSTTYVNAVVHRELLKSRASSDTCRYVLETMEVFSKSCTLNPKP